MSISVVTLGSRTTEKSDVLSAKSIMLFEFNTTGKPFRYIKKTHKSPRIEPYGSLVLTCGQYNDCPLRTTFLYCLLKKEWVDPEYFPHIPNRSVF